MPATTAAIKKIEIRIIFLLRADCCAEADTICLRFGGISLFDCECFIFESKSASRLTAPPTTVTSH